MKLTLKKIIDFRELHNAIESLATNFEPFLKKIAFLKYDTSVWKGDSLFKGINECTLYDLQHSQSSPRDSITLARAFPTPLITNSGTQAAILNFVRDTLRNGVHYAKVYNRSELITYSNQVLSVYLLAINDNLDSLKKTLSPEYNYLEEVIHDRDIAALNKIYVEIFGQQSISDLDNIAVELLDAKSFLDSLIIEKPGQEDMEESELETQVRVDSVLNIAKDTNRFVIIGDPGSGKTTTLQKVLYENALSIKNNKENSKFPIYINANAYSADTSFKALINAKLRFSTMAELVAKYHVLVLVDGLNEIDDLVKRRAFSELHFLMTEMPDVAFILSSRKHGFINNWDIPAFELKSLNESQSKQLIENALNIAECENLWPQIKERPQMLELAGNPLMLMMIIKVSSIYGGNLPKSKGQLFKLFNDTILVREAKFSRTDIETKKNILSHISYWMRDKGIFRKINKDKARQLTLEKLRSLTSLIGANDIIEELISNNFFLENQNDIEFIHETQQEYFAALEIKSRFYSQLNLPEDVYNDKWTEPLIICSEILTDEKDRQDFFEMLFVGQKSPHYKQIRDLSQEDVNPDFPIACKIAFNLKESHPTVYGIAERYLTNYLVLWGNRSPQKEKLLDTEALLAAIAILSSPKIFLKLFLHLKYSFRLFGQENSTYSSTPSRVKGYSEIFISNISDFYELNKILADQKTILDAFWGAPSIVHNIRIFYKHLLEGIAITKLISAYKREKDKKILYKIARHDIDFLIENNDDTVITKQEFFELIIAYHIESVVGQEILKKGILNRELPTKTSLRALKKLLKIVRITDNILAMIGTISKKKEFLLDIEFVEGIKTILNPLPSSVLQKHELLKFYTEPKIRLRQLAIKSEIIDDKICVFLPNNFIKTADRIITSVLINDAFVIWETTEIEEYKDVIILNGTQQELLACNSNDHGNGFIDLYFSSDESHFTRRYHYETLSLSVSADKLVIGITKNMASEVRPLLNSHKAICLVNGQYFFDVIGCMQNILASTSMKTPYMEQFHNTRLDFKLITVDIDFESPLNYHSHFFLEQPIILKFLESKILEARVRNFVKKLGLTHRFNHKELGIKYALILKAAEVAGYMKYTILNLTTGVIHDYLELSEVELAINSIAIIEENNRLTVPETFALTDDYFQISNVISVNFEREEGFIRNPDGKDFYFSFMFCDFMPEVGDVVRFVSGANFYKKYESLSSAYLVSKVDLPNLMAKLIRMHHSQDAIFLYFTDVISGKYLYARMNKNNVPVVNGLIGHFKVDQVFEYLPLPSNTFQQKIRLLRFVK